MEKEYRVINVGGGASSPTNPQHEQRITDLETDVQHISAVDLVHLELDKADKTQLNAYMTKHKFIGDLYDITLYNQIINTPNVMDGALFSVEIENETPSEMVHRGFPQLEVGSIVYGYFYHGQLDSPMIVLTPLGIFKIIDGGVLTCSRANGEEVPIEYLTPSQHQYNISTLQFDYLKGVRVWYQYVLQGQKKKQHQDIYFTDKGDPDADGYTSNPLTIPGIFADTIAIDLNYRNGEVKFISTGGVPQEFKLIDIKGLI